VRNLTRSEFLTHLDACANDNAFGDIKALVITRGAEDVEFFSEYFFPHYQKHPINQFHRDAFSKYRFGERRVRRADAAPRGSAKSTLKVLFKPVHDLVYELERFILVCSNTESQAEGRLKDIQTELLTNVDLINFFGPFFHSRKVASTDFVAHCGRHSCRFLAAGAATEVRGVRHGADRPSKIILDDIEHSEKVENEALRDKLMVWKRDVIDKIGDEETNIEVVGTILHQESLLKQLTKNPVYDGKIYQSVISWPENKPLWDQWQAIFVNLDNDSRIADALAFYEIHKAEMDRGVQVLWPEKEPYYALAIEIIDGGMRSFMKEKQNNPMADGEKCFDLESFWWYTEEAGGLRVERTGVLTPWHSLTGYMAIDPSTGQTKATGSKKTDFASIISGFKDGRNRLFVHEDWTKREAPSKQINKLLDFWEQYKHYKIGVETNLFRNLLLKNIMDEIKRREATRTEPITAKFYDIDLIENKEKRIYSLEPKVFHGHILFNKKLISQEALGQMRDFPKGRHDDFPDALEMLWGLVNNKYTIGTMNKEAG